MKRYAIINSDNVVENVVLWDEVSQWSPPERRSTIKVEDVVCGIGWVYDNGGFANPSPQLEEPPTTDTP